MDLFPKLCLINTKVLQQLDGLLGLDIADDRSYLNEGWDVICFDGEGGFEGIVGFAEVGVLEIEDAQVMLYVFGALYLIDFCHDFDGLFYQTLLLEDACSHDQSLDGTGVLLKNVVSQIQGFVHGLLSEGVAVN